MRRRNVRTPDKLSPVNFAQYDILPYNMEIVSWRRFTLCLVMTSIVKEVFRTISIDSVGVTVAFRYRSYQLMFCLSKSYPVKFGANSGSGNGGNILLAVSKYPNTSIKSSTDYMHSCLYKINTVLQQAQIFRKLITTNTSQLQLSMQWNWHRAHRAVGDEWAE